MCGITMELGPYEIALIGVGGTIVGALVGTWVGYRLSLSLSKITAKQNAGQKLRGAFKDELLALNPSQYDLEEDVPNLLDRSFQKHREAIYDYAFHLEAREKEQFYQAWYTYYCPEQNRSETSIPFLEQYSCRGFTTAEKHELMKKVRDRIEKIIEFTRA